MDLLNKIELLTESGIRNIKDLSDKYKEAEIYFHKDLDGVTSAIGMKEYLKRYGIKTVGAHPIQYGADEYAVPKPKKNKLAVMVDFAHGKPMMHIHTDHHDKQAGVEKSTSTAFVHEPSNAAFISQRLSPTDLFPPADASLISTVDSADFARQGITPDDVMRAVFKINPRLDVEKNKRAMGFATNALVLAYKNKSGFLEELVMKAKPSLMSMYNITKALAKKNGYKPPEEVQQGKMDYVTQQAEKKLQGSISDVKNLKSGGHVMIGNTLVQYGGGSMRNGYDRYTPFKNNPEAQYLIIGWPMGLVQISKNPFMAGENPHHLGNIAQKILKKYEGKFKKTPVTLDFIKYANERNIDVKDAFKMMGFTWHDVMALFKKEAIKGLGSQRWNEIVADITNTPYKKLSNKQRDLLKKVSIPLWDFIQASSGGHKDITNISGFSFAGKGFTDIMKDFMVDSAKEMKDKSLKLKE